MQQCVRAYVSQQTCAAGGKAHVRFCVRILQAHQAPLIFWDLGGQAGLRSIWDKYYAESHAILYVVDSGAIA